MSESFKTIAKQTEGSFKDRGSKFISYAIPVSDIEAVKSALNSIRSDHPSARHVCYAYLLGEDGKEYRANDDGEPNGSAGLPILNQIRSKEVTNTLVAVVRYFGGTKLGVSGLINAYKESAKEALEKAKTITRIPTALIRIQFPHSCIGEVERTIRLNSYTIHSQEFGISCQWQIACRSSEKDTCENVFRSLTNVQLF